MSLFEKIFGSSSQRELRLIAPMVDKIDSLTDQYAVMDNSMLQALSLIHI